jgi:outer membrane protein assembly factor BamB
LPAFGSATVAGEYVFFGIGNGDLLTSAETPSGALLCLANRTGRKVWRYDVPDAVHTKPLVAGDAVYFTSRDHCCYCLDRGSGQLRWRQDLGSPVVTAPVLAEDRRTGEKTSLYVAASDGLVWCLDLHTGLSRWVFDVAEHAQAQPLLLSSPAVVREPPEQGEYRRIHFGAGFRYFRNTATLYCLVEDLSD